MAAFSDLLEAADRHPARGWDFSWLGDRLETKPLPWDFAAIVSDRARCAQDMLDMGTGGGEWLAALPFRPSHTVATEAWAPNVPVARERLAPLGIDVVQVEGAPDNMLQTFDQDGGDLPFETGSFDLVVNRHESFLAAEVARVLRPGGSFITQQLGDGVFREFSELLRAGPQLHDPWCLAQAVDQIEKAGLSVMRSAEGREEVTFADVGALAWYIKMVPWTVPGFTIARYRARLGELHERIETNGPITLPLPGFYLEAVSV